MNVPWELSVVTDFKGLVEHAAFATATSRAASNASAMRDRDIF
jgi:hypothetical protein